MNQPLFITFSFISQSVAVVVFAAVVRHQWLALLAYLVFIYFFQKI